MSPVVRTGLIFGLGAIGASLGTTLLSLAGLPPVALLLIGCIGFLSTIALGLGSGYTAAKVSNATRDQRIARGTTAGAVAGAVLLVGVIILTTILVATGISERQTAAALGAQSQELRDAGIDPAQLAQVGAAAGLVGAFCSGLFNLVLMLLCGLLGSLLWKGAPAVGSYVPAGSAQYSGAPSGSYVPNQTYSGQSYGNQGINPASGSQANQPDSEGGARVYDPNDPNRPQ